MPCLAFLPCHPSARALAASLAEELEARGTVTVTLIDGFGLKAADKGGTSDPYAVLDLDSQHRRWVGAGAVGGYSAGDLCSRHAECESCLLGLCVDTNSNLFHTCPFTRPRRSGSGRPDVDSHLFRTRTHASCIHRSKTSKKAVWTR
eukprot:scaffold34691_cov124-Isochrysis_galbana.AAC.1